MMVDRLNLKVEFFSYWQCGSGRGHGRDLDSVFRRDSNGLPFIPGKTFRGILREAIKRYVHLSDNTRNIEQLLGEPGNDGLYFVDSAHLAPAVGQALLDGKSPLANLLGTYLQATAINVTGVAKEHSLRMAEVTIPLVLYTFIEPLGKTSQDNISIKKDYSLIESALPFFYIGIGAGRRRGLGRVKVSVVKAVADA